MRVHVSARKLSGQSFEAEGVMAPLSDRVAFERTFGVTAAILSRLAEAFDEEGRLRDAVDPGGIREEWVAFLAYRMLSRAGQAVGSFEEFVDGVDEISIAQRPEEEEQAPAPFEIAEARRTSSGS